MNMKTLLSAFVLGLVVKTVVAAPAAAAGVGKNTTKIHYLVSPNVTWSSLISPLLRGNGMHLSSDDKILLSTSMDGTVNRFHPILGTLLWTYQPSPISNSLISCHSGISFASDDSFFIYSIIDNEGTSSEMTRVVAVDPSSGKEIWQSLQLPGVAMGTPVLSNDDRFVFLTHNTNSTTIGHFSILVAASATAATSTTNKTSSSSSISRLLFTSNNTTNPYAPLGIYHNPVEGYYDGGEGNRNDILVWAYTAKPTDTKVGTGGLFAFQFPIGFTSATTSSPFVTSQFVVHYLGDNSIDFQSVSKPVMTNQGLSLYYAGSRSQWRCWVGTLGKKANYYSRARTNLLAFDRGTPPSSPAFNTLALSHSSILEPMVFGGTAALEFASANFNFTVTKNVTTNSLVMTEARVSPDDLVVYYIEVDGFLHQARTGSLADQWVEPLPSPVKAEMALRSDGSMVYLGDVSGNIIAYQVARMPTAPKTAAPSSSPTVISANGPSPAPHAKTPSTNSIKPIPHFTTTPGRGTTAPQGPSAVKPATASKSPFAVVSFAPTVATTSLSTIIPTLGGSVAAPPTSTAPVASTTTAPVSSTTAKPVATSKTSVSSCISCTQGVMTTLIVATWIGGLCWM